MPASHRIAPLLFVLTLLLRVPFVSQTLNHWDSVNLAFGVLSFDVLAHRPQPPGYILYIGSARLIYLLFPDPQTALVMVSILASALAVTLLFLLGTRMASREIGLIAALLLLTSPSFWFDGEVALPYVVEGCAAIALALVCYKLARGETQVAPLVAVVFAITVGLRQQMAFYITPLVLYAYWHQPWRVRFVSLVWFGGVCLLWFLPLIATTGGPGPYLTAMANYSRAFAPATFLTGTGGLPALLRNIGRIGAYTTLALNATLIPMLAGAVRVARAGAIRELWKDVRTRFFAVWILPGVLFYSLFHMGSPGLIYAFLPALLLIGAFVLYFLFKNQPQWRAASLLALCAVNVFIFIATPPDLYTGTEVRILNYSALVEHDRSLSSRVNAIRQNFDPATTLVLANDWRFAEYYLPAFRVVFLPTDAGEPLVVSYNQQEQYMRARSLNLSQIETLVWFDETLPQTYRNVFRECRQLPTRSCLPFTQLENKGGVTLESNRIEVRPP